MLSDLAVAQQATLKHVHEIAEQMGLKPIKTIVTKICGTADVNFDVHFEPLAEKQIRDREASGMAKTRLSLTCDPTLEGAPRGFALPGGLTGHSLACYAELHHGIRR